MTERRGRWRELDLPKLQLFIAGLVFQAVQDNPNASERAAQRAVAVFMFTSVSTVRRACRAMRESAPAWKRMRFGITYLIGDPSRPMVQFHVGCGVGELDAVRERLAEIRKSRGKRKWPQPEKVLV